LKRTEWAEHETRELLSIPFISEFVFRDLRTIDGRKDHQAGDFLMLQAESGILVEQKCQENPGSRTVAKERLWAKKSAKEAWSQIRRALTRPKNRPVWCDHPRRGRVEFPNGLPRISHALAIVEVRGIVNLESDAEHLPLEYRGVPVAYLSVNDFLNLAVNLRTIPELNDYLENRRALPPTDLRHIGDEKTLFEFFLLNGGSFSGYQNRDSARQAVVAQKDRLLQILDNKSDADRFAGLIEHVADALARRNPHYAEDLPEQLLAAYDTPEARTGYLAMQDAVAMLGLRARSELGRSLHEAVEKISEQEQGFTFMAARFDSAAEWVYVLGSSKKVPRPDVASRSLLLMRGAMAYYQKKRCLVIIDRDSLNYEVAVAKEGFTPTSADFEFGKKLFGTLCVTSKPLSLVP